MPKECPRCGEESESKEMTFAIGNDELDALPWLDELHLPCRECGKMCDVVTGYDYDIKCNGEYVGGTSLSIISCSDCKKQYLVGMNGKKLNWEDE